MFGADDATPVRFEVEAPCSDAPRFAESVAARTPRVRPTDARDADSVQVKADTSHGSFRIVPAKGEPSAERTLEGTSCEEIVSALGLAVALVFDPDATDKAAPKPAPSPSPSPAASPSLSRFPAPIVIPSPPSRPSRPPPALAIGIHGTVAGARDLPLGASGFGEVLSHRVSARLAFGFQRASVDVGTLSADFTWGLITPDVCPLRFIGDSLELTPCLGMAFGVVEAEPDGIPNASSFARAWIAPKPILRARLYFGSSFAIEAQLAAEIPLVRGRYTFGNVTAYDVASVVPSFALGGWYSP